MAGTVKTNEVKLVSPNGLVEKTLKLNDDGTVSIDAPIKQDGILIVESGSNANGNYTKFSDGTLIVYHTLGGYGIMTGALNSVRWTFPVSFISNAYSVSAIGQDYASTWFWVHMDKQPSHADVYLGGNRNNYTNAMVMAIGRWK